MPPGKIAMQRYIQLAIVYVQVPWSNNQRPKMEPNDIISIEAQLDFDCLVLSRLAAKQLHASIFTD